MSKVPGKPRRKNPVAKQIERLETEIESQRREGEALGSAAVEELEAILQKYGHISVLDIVRNAVEQCKTEIRREEDRLKAVKAAIDKAAKRGS